MRVGMANVRMAICKIWNGDKVENCRLFEFLWI